METKVCCHCKKELPATTDFFHKKPKGKNGLNSNCKECRSIVEKTYPIDKEKRKNTTAKYRKTNKCKESLKRHRLTEKGKLTNRRSVSKYAKTHVEYVRAKRLKSANKQTLNLTDSYIKANIQFNFSKICGFISRTQITDIHIIEAERQRLLLKREIKNLQSHGKQDQLRAEYCSDAGIIQGFM